MSDDREADLELDPDEREFAKLLSQERPVPAARFRSALARRLARDDPGYGPRPARLGLMVVACCGGGSVLLALGALSALGAS